MVLERGQIAIINAGGWGTALSVLLGSAGYPVQLWCRRAELAAEINARRLNQAYLPGGAIPATVHATADLAEALDGASAVVLVPISRAMRDLARAVAPHLTARLPILHATKGLETETLKRLSEVVAEELGAAWAGRVGVLSGPTHAEEVARGLPTAAVVACQDRGTAELFQDLLHSATFRVYTSDDVVGVELCGALKNVIALAIGAADGLGYGDNARAALITRALAELGRLVQCAGGDVRTVAGLAGMGDLVATCTSQHSRNRWAGEQLARGLTLEQVLASTPQVVEGVPATRAALALAARYGVDVPICAEVHRVLYEGASVQSALQSLMGREATAELR